MDGDSPSICWSAYITVARPLVKLGNCLLFVFGHESFYQKLDLVSTLKSVEQAMCLQIDAVLGQFSYWSVPVSYTHLTLPTTPYV